MVRKLIDNYQVALETVLVVAVLVALRWVLWEAGVEGMTLSPLTSSIVAGGVFVMGLVIAGTLSDYKDAERAPTDLASSLYSILRETESMDKVWGEPNMGLLRQRLITVVTSLRADINAGTTRECQQAIEDLSESFLELENTDVPANYVVRLRQEQAALRKTALRVYHIQREEFLPSAYAMIVSLVVIILGVVLFTDFQGLLQSVVTMGFLSFFFLYLLRLLRVIDKPFKVGHDRTDDDVSLFLLLEFVVHAGANGKEVAADDVEAMAEEVEVLLADAEHEEAERMDAEEEAEPRAEDDDAAIDLTENPISRD